MVLWGNKIGPPMAWIIFKCTLMSTIPFQIDFACAPSKFRVLNFENIRFYFAGFLKKESIVAEILHSKLYPIKSVVNAI